MFNHPGFVLFSVTDLVNYLGCRHATFLDLAQLGESAPHSEVDLYADLLKRKGLEHEQRHLASMIGAGKRVVSILDGPLEERVEQTLAAITEGADVIYQAALFDPPWHGYADFLVRVEGYQTRLGNYGYEVVDAKLARTARPKHIIQLCTYSKLLARVQERLPGNIHVVLGDRTLVSWPLADFLHYAEFARKRIETFVRHPPRESFGEPCAHCGICRWRDHCAAEWEAADHLSLVASITRSQVAKIEAEGIVSVRALARLSARAAVPGLQPDTLDRLRRQARLQVRKRDTGKDCHELLEPRPGKGFARLPRPDPGDLFFDMEGDPLFEGGLEYLFGVAYGANGTGRFKSFWAHSRGEERRAFGDAVGFMARRLARHPEAHIYHYAQYEETALKRLSTLHGTCETEVDNLLRRRKLVDLYKVVRESIQVSEPRYSLKNIEAFFMPERDGDVNTAGDSIVVYEQWRELGDPGLLEQIEQYNATDCRSTRLLRDWLLSLRPRRTPWFSAPPAEDEAPDRAERRSEAEERLRSTTARLLHGVGEEERRCRELIGQLLDFHRREAKPQWWATFHRQELSEEQLIDDVECIGGLRRDRDRAPQPDKRSTIHHFRFPAQDYKLRVGERVLRAATLEPAGELVEIDDETFSLSLRIGNSAPGFPNRFSIIPGGPLDARVLRDAIYRCPYNLQVDLLRRTLPGCARVGTVDKFQGQEAAVVLISMATSSSEDMPRSVEFLYSRNRLNVALSRARCLAVIFASPRLLQASCSTIEQMRLVNALCWAKSYAEATQSV